jgi:hypothetical protein
MIKKNTYTIFFSEIKRSKPFGRTIPYSIKKREEEEETATRKEKWAAILIIVAAKNARCHSPF